MVCLIAVNNDVLPAFTCASATGNLQSICLGVNILSFLWLKTLQSEPYLQKPQLHELRELSPNDVLLYILFCIQLQTQFYNNYEELFINFQRFLIFILHFFNFFLPFTISFVTDLFVVVVLKVVFLFLIFFCFSSVV